jgi:imidazolonepropionase-like amidohydrolase
MRGARVGSRCGVAVVLLAALAAAGCRPAPVTAPVAVGGTLVLVNGTLIDGTGSGPVGDAALVLDGATITYAGARALVRYPGEARVVDAEGGTILPAFINAHVHDAYSATRLEAWAAAGVTTVRDEGIIHGTAQLRDLVARRDTEWTAPRFARLITTGWIVGPPGGYGQLEVADAAAARQAANDELDQGADQLKVAVEDGTPATGAVPVIPLASLVAFVQVAHQRGTRVSAHVTDAYLLPMLLDAGVDDAAHVTWDSVPDAVYRRMIGLGIAMVPTLTVQEAYGALAGAQANLRRFVALGGRVALGNDYTDPPQNGFPHFELGMPMWEITRMAGAGMTPMQVIVAGTRNAAAVCGLGDRLGTLEAGKLGDVLVVSGDPLRDVGALTAVRLVLHGGVVIRGGP